MDGGLPLALERVSLSLMEHGGGNRERTSVESRSDQVQHLKGEIHQIWSTYSRENRKSNIQFTLIPVFPVN